MKIESCCNEIPYVSHFNVKPYIISLYCHRCRRAVEIFLEDLNLSMYFVDEDPERTIFDYYRVDIIVDLIAKWNKTFKENYTNKDIKNDSQKVQARIRNHGD